jgi:hypothetical protein
MLAKYPRSVLVGRCRQVRTADTRLRQEQRARFARESIRAPRCTQMGRGSVRLRTRMGYSFDVRPDVSGRARPTTAATAHEALHHISTAPLRSEL